MRKILRVILLMFVFSTSLFAVEKKSQTEDSFPLILSEIPKISEDTKGSFSSWIVHIVYDEEIYVFLFF